MKCTYIWSHWDWGFCERKFFNCKTTTMWHSQFIKRLSNKLSLLKICWGCLNETLTPLNVKDLFIFFCNKINFCLPLFRVEKTVSRSVQWVSCYVAFNKTWNFTLTFNHLIAVCMICPTQLKLTRARNSHSSYSPDELFCMQDEWTCWNL